MYPEPQMSFCRNHVARLSPGRHKCPNCEGKSTCEVYRDGHAFCFRCELKIPAPKPHQPRRSSRLERIRLPRVSTPNIDFQTRWDNADADIERIRKNAYVRQSKLRSSATLQNFRIETDETLVAKLQDSDGNIQAIQEIRSTQGTVKKSAKNPSGRSALKTSKQFAKGSEPKGAYAPIGAARDPKTIYVGEALTTCGSAWESLLRKERKRTLVVAAMSSGNIPRVVEALHGKFPNAAIVLLRDQDEAGERAVRKTQELVPHLELKVASPGFKNPKKSRNDFNDLLKKKGRKAVRNALANAMLAYSGPLRHIHSINEFVTRKFRRVTDALLPIVQNPGITQINGKRGDGKTWLAMYIAVALASGQHLFGWICDRALKVLFVDGELPPWIIKKRFQAAMADLGVESDMGNLHIHSVYESDEGTFLNLADPKQTEAIVQRTEDFDVVVYDNISALTSNFDPNSAEDWQTINQLHMRQRGMGISVIRVQHLGKDKARGGRGSSVQEDPVDVVLTLERQTASTMDGDETIRVSCDKSRNHPLNEVAAVDLHLSKNKDGGIRIRAKNAYQTKREIAIAAIVPLMREGEWRATNKSKLAKKLGMDRSTLNRAITAADRILREEKASNED